jgi:hypothetical protein
VYPAGALAIGGFGRSRWRLNDSTLFIVTAKHGQSPINPAKINKPGHFASLVAALPDGNSNPAAIAITTASNCPTGPCGFVQDDDIALIWLQWRPVTNQQVTDYLNTNAVLPSPQHDDHKRSRLRRRTRPRL